MMNELGGAALPRWDRADRTRGAGDFKRRLTDRNAEP